MNPTGKSDKNHDNTEDKSKHLIDEALEKFNRSFSIRITRNK